MPIQIASPEYYIFIYDKHIKIGCEFHTINDWFSFDHGKIIKMDGERSLSFWKKWKKVLQEICKAEKRG